MFDNYFALEMTMKFHQSQLLKVAADIRLARAAKAGRGRPFAAAAITGFGKAVSAVGLWRRTRWDSGRERSCQDCQEPLAS